MSKPASSSAQSYFTFRTISALMLREMTSTYGRSVAGYFWALAEPVGGVILLTFVFSLALRAPALGDSFALYYASGFLPFSAFMDLARKTSGSIKFSKTLLHYPRVTYIDAILARVILNSLTQFMIGAVILAVLIPFSRSHIFLNAPAVLLSYVMAISLAVSIGTLNCYLFWRFPAWERVWNVITRPLFIGSAIFYNFESVPESVKWLLWYNPLIHVVGQAREGIYALYEPTYISLTYVFGISAGLTMLGLFMLWLKNKEIVNG